MFSAFSKTQEPKHKFDFNPQASADSEFVRQGLTNCFAAFHQNKSNLKQQSFLLIIKLSAVFSSSKFAFGYFIFISDVFVIEKVWEEVIKTFFFSLVSLLLCFVITNFCFPSYLPTYCTLAQRKADVEEHR